MEEIKVGDFVRTKEGIIDKVTIDYKGKCNNPNCNYKHISCKCNYYDEENIVKHSSNIIDLIEVGDYVNGSEVVAEKYKNYDMNFINVDSKISFGWGYGVIPENDIKSIVTKEQFESESYRLEE